MRAQHATGGGGIVKASISDTLAVIAEVILPTVGKGVLIRRPRMVSLAERYELDSRGVRRLQRLRRKYGAGPLLLAIPGRRQAVILAHEHVHRVLQGAPEPFAPSTLEKRAALAHFEPRVALISHLPERHERRRFNDDVLESGCPVHSMADAFLAVVDDEAQALLNGAGARLHWDRFIAAWYRMARRVILGEGAREDHELTDMLARLRGAGNWAFLHPTRKTLRNRFHERLAAHLRRAEPGSLAARIAARPETDVTAPTDQVAQWLFAFDAGGIAGFRALALIASHPYQEERARAEITAAGKAGRHKLPFLRACFLEALRLWPTTPAILRETTEAVRWDGEVMPKNTNILIFAPFFHRDGETLPEADRFAPDLWLNGPPAHAALVPFSAGPAKCPGHHLVPMLASAMLAAILEGRRVALADPDRLDPERPLPGALDYYSLRFDVTPAPTDCPAMRR